ncbi:MAG: hypothetical protein HY912_09170 [Desulfomonile tiedjei]|uniref:Uncharacterized protein n=1 Tax=Desulfomonile tiedjei TaxID=2358 RepID=A0A9D6V5U7_9BACT|nr:hypothetical protein [Desulfomonile tiedjei]
MFTESIAVIDGQNYVGSSVNNPRIQACAAHGGTHYEAIPAESHSKSGKFGRTEWMGDDLTQLIRMYTGNFAFPKRKTRLSHLKTSE